MKRRTTFMKNRNISASSRSRITKRRNLHFKKNIMILTNNDTQINSTNNNSNISTN